MIIDEWAEGEKADDFNVVGNIDNGVFIVSIDRAWEEDSNGGIIVIVIVDFGQNPKLECRFGARHSDSRVDFVEYIDKVSIFDVGYSANR